MQNELDDVLDIVWLLAHSQTYLHSLEGDDQKTRTGSEIPFPLNLALFPSVPERSVKSFFKPRKVVFNASRRVGIDQRTLNHAVAHEASQPVALCSGRGQSLEQPLNS